MREKHVEVPISAAIVMGALILCLGVALAFLVATFKHTAVPRAQGPEQSPSAPPAVVIAGPSGHTEASVAPVVRRALPAVVNVASLKMVRTPANGPSYFFSDPFFQRFFGNLLPEAPAVPMERRERSLGSGVIVRSDGIILTNSHVIAGASDVKVVTADKREFKAKVVGSDPKSDIAVLKIDAKNLPTLPLGDSAKLQIGDFVLAIGDPFGIGETVTMGIVSAVGRGHLDIEDYEDFIQTDAAINPGNSGGALIDFTGNLVGINTAILTNIGGGNQGIGFAVPINMARHVMEEILRYGKVVRGYLGVRIQDVAPGIAKYFHAPSANGALVSLVEAGSPAGKAGLKSGDIILAIDGAPVPDANVLRLRVSELAPKKKIRLHILREGVERDISVELGELPLQTGEQAPGAPSSGILGGVKVVNLTPQIAEEVGVPKDTTGVVISVMEPGSPPAEAGLRRGDIIQEINRLPIRNVADFDRVAQTLGDSAVLLIKRRSLTLFVLLEK
jgi:serine protease Do